MYDIVNSIKIHYKFYLALEVAMAAGLLAVFGRAGIGFLLIATYSAVSAVILFIKMVRDIFNGSYGVDILAVMAIVSTLAVGEYWASIVIVLMMVGGEELEKFAGNRARLELSSLLDRVPKVAHKQMVDGSVRDVEVGKVLPGDIVVVHPGEVVPVDGRIISGQSSLDESSLTGESQPVDVAEGDDILSGAVNGESPLVVHVVREAKDSQYAQIVKLVRSASQDKAPFVRLADKYAVPFTAISFVIAGLAWWVSGDARRFAEVLVVATPCPLLLAAPIAMISGMSRAAKHGIIIKTGSALEKLAMARAAAFDKTGTLTYGSLALDEILPEQGITSKELIQVVASAEQASEHLTANAVVKHAKKHSIRLLAATDISEVSGGGIVCKINKHLVVAGKRAFLIKHGISSDDLPSREETAVYVAVGKKYIGRVTYKDHERSDARATLRRMKALGIERFVMLTGDHESTARRIAKGLAITDIHAGCLPKDKLQIVKDFPVRPIMMVGDGVNDAPVLAASDVGVAMGARGATAASESADVVIMLDEFSKVAVAVAVAQRTLSVARQSVLIGIAISIVLMLIASLGYITAVAGALLQELLDVVVIVYALRAHSDSRVVRGRII